MNINIKSREDIFTDGKEVYYYDDGIHLTIKEDERYTNWARFEVNDQGIFLRPASKIPFFKTLEEAEEDLRNYV